ncbi:hypothetical protein [Flavobacterium phragmitis]|uniref:Uncharacterized protein n=1 Tax=Flavobacterium phragmitis TaxID=739143 RepID=A0A1I1K3E8_9FLAO|nr:hypothetical protein [Flavobacterium phragmitis]SFC55041.1 hypothetical protein SAMN05216297_101224 [Flavobacterium phragmitis]
MKKIHFILLLFTCKIYCQDISYIRTLDTIFVNFNKDKFQTKTVFPKNKIDFCDRWYTFNFEDFTEKRNKVHLQFWYTIYPSSDRREIGIKSDFKLVKKSYLRKHEKQIISIAFFKKYGIYRSTYEAFENCKVIYIIDNTEKKNGKIPLYEVSKYSSYMMKE